MATIQQVFEILFKNKILVLCTVLFVCSSCDNKEHISSLVGNKHQKRAALFVEGDGQKLERYFFGEKVFDNYEAFLKDKDVAEALKKDCHIHTELDENNDKIENNILFESDRNYYNWAIKRDPKHASYFNADFEYVTFVQETSLRDPEYSDQKYSAEINAIFEKYGLSSPFSLQNENNNNPQPESTSEPCIYSSRISITFSDNNYSGPYLDIFTSFRNCEQDVFYLTNCIDLRNISTYLYIRNPPYPMSPASFINGFGSANLNDVFEKMYMNPNNISWNETPNNQRPEILLLAYSGFSYGGTKRSVSFRLGPGSSGPYVSGLSGINNQVSSFRAVYFRHGY